MPVDPGGGAHRRFGTARFDEQLDLVAGVLLVRVKMGAGPQLRSEELLRPVALLAGFPRRAQVLDRRMDRPTEGVERHGQHLAHAADLRLHVPVGARADVAGGAADAGVRRVQVAGVLGVHDRVADLPAKLRRVGVVVPLVTADRNQGQDNESPEREDHEQPAMVRVVGIKVRQPRPFGDFRVEPPSFPALEHRAQGDQGQPRDQNRGKHQERPQPGVRVAGGLHQLDQLEADEEKYGERGQDDAGFRDPVLPNRFRLVHETLSPCPFNCGPGTIREPEAKADGSPLL